MYQEAPYCHHKHPWSKINMKNTLPYNFRSFFLQRKVVLTRTVTLSYSLILTNCTFLLSCLYLKVLKRWLAVTPICPWTPRLMHSNHFEWNLCYVLFLFIFLEFFIRRQCFVITPIKLLATDEHGTFFCTNMPLVPVLVPLFLWEYESANNSAHNTRKSSPRLVSKTVNGFSHPCSYI